MPILTLYMTFQMMMIVGHNPGLEELVEILTGESHVMPTCSLAYVKLDVQNWLEIDYNTKGRLVRIWQPRDLL